MSTAAKNIDFLFWPLTVAGISTDDPLKKQMDLFAEDVKRDLFSYDLNLKKIILHRLPAIFEIRLAASKRLKEEKTKGLEIIEDEVSPYFKVMQKVKRLSHLALHILVVLEYNKKVILSIKRAMEEDFPNIHALEIPAITFQELADVILVDYPNQREYRLRIEFIECSLFIEYIIVAAIVINDEKLLIKENRIIELSAMLAEATQAYISLACELNLISPDEAVKAEPKNNSKGAAIFSKMLKDKNTISKHLRNGGELADLKDAFNFVKPISLTAQ